MGRAPTIIASIALAFTTTATVGQDGGTVGPEVIVVAVRPARDVVVQAPPHCYRRSGDPVDAVAVHGGVTEQRVIAPDKAGQLMWRRDDEPVQGPAVWQRAGNAIGDYRFRIAPDASLMCIGALSDSPNGWGQLRQIVSSKGMRGRYVHFSALVATRNAELVRFWLAAAGRTQASIGGDTHNYPLKGTHGWQQVDLLVGPVPAYADHVSYGFLLYGGGDVWLTAPRLDTLTREEAATLRFTPTDKLLPYGQR